MKIYIAKLVGAKGSERLEIEVYDAEEQGESVSYRENGVIRFLFRSAVGKPRGDEGIGWTPEQAVESFRLGKIAQAEKLETKAAELRRLATLEANG